MVGSHLGSDTAGAGGPCPGLRSPMISRAIFLLGRTRGLGLFIRIGSARPQHVIGDFFVTILAQRQYALEQGLEGIALV